MPDFADLYRVDMDDVIKEVLKPRLCPGKVIMMSTPNGGSSRFDHIWQEVMQEVMAEGAKIAEPIDEIKEGFRPTTAEELKAFMSDSPQQRGSALAEALEIINGERLDTYGNPEDSFSLIAELWTVYLEQFRRPEGGRGFDAEEDFLRPDDVAMMMVLFKLARQMHQGKRDNVVDAAGYLGLLGDLMAK